MNKADLLNFVANAADLPKADAGKVIDAVFDAIAGTLKAGGEVSLVGFGAFRVVDRLAREGKNPKTGEPIQIAAGRAPKFKAGTKLRDAVNGVVPVQGDQFG